MENFKKFFTEKLAEKIILATVSDEVKYLIRSIYKKVFRKEINETCNSCFTDAFFELYNLYKADKEKFSELFECEYEMRYGAMLSEFSNTETICTRNNVTNKLAEHHLRINPACIDQFEVFPEDWMERIAVAEEGTGEKGTILPEGFPARQKLIDSGFDTIEKLKACTDLLAITGIGEVSAAQISEALTNL